MLQKISDIIIGLSGAGVRVTCYRRDVSTSVQRMVSIRRQCGPDQSPASTTTTAPPHPAQLGGGTQHINSNNNNNHRCVWTVCGTVDNRVCRDKLVVTSAETKTAEWSK